MDNGTKKSLIAIGFICLAFLIIGACIGVTFAPTREAPVYMPRAYYYPLESEEAEEKTETVDALPASYQRAEDLGEFKLTAYCACEECNGKWVGEPTASGTEMTVGRTVAVDPEVIPLGSTVYINGFAYVAEDTGSAIKGNRIDVLLPTHEEALDFGVQYANVSIIK